MYSVTETQKRKIWIDLARGIAIWLVVWGHVVQPQESRGFTFIGNIRQLVYSFHMPLFFMISGLCFNVTLSVKFSEFAKKKFKTILIPGYIGVLVGIIYQCLFADFDYGAYIRWGGVLRTLLYFHDADFTYWFLGALFCVELLMFFVCRMNNWFYRILTSLLLTVAGYVVHIVINMPLPFSLNQGLELLIFFSFGYECKGICLRIKGHRGREIALALLSLIICIIANLLDDEIVSYWNASPGDFVGYIVKGFSGSIMVISIALLCESCKNWLINVLTLNGRCSLFIYIYSGFILLILRRYTSLNSLSSPIVNVIMNLLITCLICIVIDLTVSGVKSLKRISQIQ